MRQDGQQQGLLRRRTGVGKGGKLKAKGLPQPLRRRFGSFRESNHQGTARCIGNPSGAALGEGPTAEGDRGSQWAKGQDRAGPPRGEGLSKEQGRGPVVTTGHALGLAPAGHLRGRLALNAGLTGRVSRSRSRRGSRSKAASVRLWSTLVEVLVLVPGFGLRLAASPGLLDRARRVPSGLRGLCAHERPSKAGQGGLK